MRRRRAPAVFGVWAIAAMALGCGDGEDGRGGDPAGLGDDSAGDTSVGGDGGPGDSTSAADGDPTAAGTTGDGGPAMAMCSYLASDYGEAPRLLDVPGGSTEALTFLVPGLPDPAVVDRAMLHYQIEDADHPGEEGFIRVNGAGDLQIPADTSQDNVVTQEVVEVTDLVVSGENRIDFAAGTFDGGTYFLVADVRIEVEVSVDACPEPPPLPDGEYQEMGYLDAEYTMRHNWVLRCDGAPYAFTAQSAEHLDKDCDGLYAPDGTRDGTAIFTFTDVAPGNYRIEIEAFHSGSRNPNGAMFVVDGIGGRVNQYVDPADAGFATGVWGEKVLSGTVEIVLDSGADGFPTSDSVGIVKLVPAP